MAHPNENLVQEGFAAFGRGDMDALRKQFFTDDVRWHNPCRGLVTVMTLGGLPHRARIL